MFKIKVEQENHAWNESGYGVYVNAYVIWEDDPWDGPPSNVDTLYASECVSFDKNTPEELRMAGKRVRAKARRRARKEYVDNG